MFRTLYFLFLGLLLPPWLGQCQYKVYRQDPFALLSGTLQTYQEASCDNEALSLECPAGTKISIQLVQYGRSAPSAQVRPNSESPGYSFAFELKQTQSYQAIFS